MATPGGDKPDPKEDAQLHYSEDAFVGKHAL